jgi:hypothetical protein
MLGEVPPHLAATFNYCAARVELMLDTHSKAGQPQLQLARAADCRQRALQRNQVTLQQPLERPFYRHAVVATSVFQRLVEFPGLVRTGGGGSLPFPIR